MMRVGNLKSYILHSESKGDIDFSILKIDSSNDVLLQVENNNKVIVRKRLSNLDTAKHLIKTAVVGRDQPRAFDKNSPSNNPFSNNGGGGLLDYIEDEADDYNEKKKKKKKKKKFNKHKFDKDDKDGDGTVEKPTSQNQELWSEPGGDDGSKGYSLVKFEPGRDDRKDTPGYNSVLRKTKEDLKEPIPVGDDPLTTLDKPEETNPNYDHSYGTDNPQNYEDRAKQRSEKAYNARQRRLKEHEEYVVHYKENGKMKKSRPLGLEEANKIKRKKDSAEIKRK
jgi:hypothetical protein